MNDLYLGVLLYNDQDKIRLIKCRKRLIIKDVDLEQ